MGAVRSVPSTTKYMGPPTTTTTTMMGTLEKQLNIYSIHTRQNNLKGMYICADLAHGCRDLHLPTVGSVGLVLRPRVSNGKGQIS